MSNFPRFVLDENMPNSVMRLLESRGFSAERPPKGISNGKAAAFAKDRKAVFLSRDADFLNTSLFEPKEYSGIIVFVIHPPKKEKLVAALSMLLSDVSEFSGKLFIVSEERYTIKE